MALATCSDCGGDLKNGLCPHCLIKLGLDGAGPSSRELGATHALTRSVLETIAATIGAVPRVLLRDTIFDEEASAIIPPKPGDVDTTLRYRIDGEIARGGMGAILKGRDPDLGRDVAIKVLREDLSGNDDLVRRFVEEAQIGGQLQHPGVGPIYELGTFADHRPFFCMKLVKGQTLAELLAGRATPADDLPRFLAIFAAMAQTMAYAHTRGVIHRDLKPSNVMVGSFGEVQVMDWGLAKVLTRGGIVDDARAGKEKYSETMIATAQSGSDIDLSHAGSILGTPSYMPPEQARGETDRIDERADVFALGSILCEILTGRPVFTGRSSGEILRNAARGDTARTLEKLDACGAEAALIALTSDCLAVEPEDRPCDANALAERITGYLAGVQERVQAAERERAVAVARAIEERKRRRLQLGLAASVLAITTMGGLGALYEQRQRSARAATVAKLVAEASTLRDLARVAPEDVARWRTALAAVKQAEEVAAGDAEAVQQLAMLKVEVQAGDEAAERDRVLLNRLIDIRSARADDHDGGATNAAYAGAFRDAGLDLAALTPAEVGARIKARPPGTTLALAAMLDDWSAVRRGLQNDPAGAGRLAEVARIADPDPWRNDLRVALANREKDRRKQALQALAGLAKFDDVGAVSLNLLGNGLIDAGDAETSEKVMRRAQLRYAGDVWVNHDLGQILERRNNRQDEAIRFYTAARAINPETAHSLAHALANKGESDEAVEVYRDLIRLRPKMGRYSTCLGNELRNHGRSKEAAEAYDRAIALEREAVRLKPDDALAHSNLGLALSKVGKYDDSIAECREAIRLKPDDALTHYNLGCVLGFQGKPADSIAEFREAIRLKPDDAAAHNDLGVALANSGRIMEASDEFRNVVQLKPDNFKAHNDLGLALHRLGNHDEGIAELRKAILLNPDSFWAYDSLGFAHLYRGDYAESLAMFRKGHELSLERPSMGTTSPYWIAFVEPMPAMADRFRALLRGEYHPKDNAERLTLARMLYISRRPVAALRLWTEALQVDPKFGDDPVADYRYEFASIALLISSGRGAFLLTSNRFDEGPPPDDAARTMLRGEALGWLKAALADLSKVLDTGPENLKAVIVPSLEFWQRDEGVAVARDPEGLSRLPAAEREQWRSFWADVDALLKRSSKPKP